LAERALHFTDTQEMATACKHPKVRIVSRHEDTEFVECLDCGEVFDSEEFRDMELEETVETEEASGDF
jgi:Fe2+ or Zn2+ uptake regulation protein